jgi:hypothetical protein
MIDLAPIVQPTLAVIGAVIAGILAIYVPKALAAFEARTGIQLTEQQRQTVLGSVQTAAGTIETKLDQKILTVAHVTINDPVIREQAQKAIAAVPNAAAALGMTVDGVSRMIVGRINTAEHGEVAVNMAAKVPVVTASH